MKTMYRTDKYHIKKGHKLYNYCHGLCLSAAILYNRANFLLRQYATAVRDFEQYKPLTENQLTVWQMISDITGSTKYAPKGKWLTYGTLDYVLKSLKDPAYMGLPAQANQQVLKLLLRDYKSFFESLKEYRFHPEKFTGRPKLPKYVKQGSCKTAILTNQICRIVDGRFLKMPGIKTRLNLHKRGSVTLKEVRILYHCHQFEIEVVTESAFQGITEEDNQIIIAKYRTLSTLKDFRVLSIDPGIDNICAVTNNFGSQPLVIKGSMVKSENRYYNKQLARYRSSAMKCNGLHDTAKIARLTSKRNRYIYDALHKISRYIVNYAVSNKVDMVILGHNQFQKQEITLGHINNQNFVQIPQQVLAGMLRYKLLAEGICFLETEESYTSKADYLAMDEIPVYTKGDNGKHSFSGKRIKRGLYRHYDGSISNADINGAANIMRKVFPKVSQWDRGVVDTPVSVRLA